MKTNAKTTTETAVEEKKVSAARRAASFELKKTVEIIRDAINGDKVNDWEKGFLTDLAERFEKFGLSCRLSVMQVMTMNRIVAKAALAA